VDEGLNRTHVADIGEQLVNAEIVKTAAWSGQPVATCIFRASSACSWERGNSDGSLHGAPAPILQVEIDGPF
jgi:hypothetical protein